MYTGGSLPMHVNLSVCMCLCLVSGPGTRALQLVRCTKPPRGHIRTQKIWGELKTAEKHKKED